MTPSGQTLCLAMIVKDEAPVIVRCLASVRPLIDNWVVCDTGSSDDTQTIVREFMMDVPGELVERPWIDFAHNRNESLELARPRADYTLLIDADDELVIPEGFQLPALDADAYSFDIELSGLRYRRPQLVSNRRRWRYRGVLHEFLHCDGEIRWGELPLLIRCGRDGRRRRDPHTYALDAARLETALDVERDPLLVSRYTFYLAQTYRDSQQPERALAAYSRRAGQGFWSEEIFVSLLQVARLKEQLGHPVGDVLAAYRAAAEQSPHRAEAWHDAARLCRLYARHAEGFGYAERAVATPRPQQGLFVEDWIYDYGALDEFGVLGYWAGRYRQAFDACLRLLASPALPEADRARVAENVRFCADRMRAEPALFRPAGLAPGQFAPQPPRGLLSTAPAPAPKVLLAVLAKQKARTLPLYLRCLEALDYPKSSIALYVRTNNNTDATAEILEAWLARVGPHYASVDYDASDVLEPVQNFDVHEWNETRFRVLAKIRQASLDRATQLGCDYYFTADVDNFLRSFTLRELVALGLPIVAPLLRASREDDP